MTILSLAANPPPFYRPVPFWSWNDELEPSELEVQIDQMHEAGLGGFFMHARGGLLTHYMSDEWFAAIRASIRAAKKHGMMAWAYDENGWPSGFGDGVIPAKGLDFQQKYLRLAEMAGEQAYSHERLIAIYDLEGKRLEATSRQNLPNTVLAAYFDVNPYYVDTLNPTATKAFITEILERYRDELSPDDAAAMRGFFTDEPQISRNGIPWSFGHADAYRSAYGEDLLDVLPRLFREIGDFRQVRCRFWRLTTRMFMNAFLKQLYEWCEQNDWELTGHMVLEETYHAQITTNGAAMPMYQYFHIPGMDALGRFFPGLATPVQVASVAAQTGKKQVLSETFACCGWAVSFADLKWMYQWQMVHGINLLCQHLQGYSLRGIRKRDYPASLFRHQPWWPYYRQFNDYVSRLGVLLSEGAVETDVLLIHGISSAHLLFDYTDEGKIAIQELFQHFITLSQQLFEAHIDHHYGDETIMEQHGAVEGDRLRVGQQRYRVVVLPKLTNLSSRQVELLVEFARQGGVILAERSSSESILVDGQEAPNLPLLKLLTCCPGRAELLAAVARLARPLAVVTPGMATEYASDPAAQIAAIHATMRRFDDFDGRPAWLQYYVNTERDQAVNVDILVAAPGVERFDPETGGLVPVCAAAENGFLRLRHRFEPAGDLALIVRDTATPMLSPSPSGIQSFPSLRWQRHFQVAAVTDNLLTLDFADYAIDGEAMPGPEYVLTIQEKLLQRQQDANLALTFTFQVENDYDLAKPLALLLERPEKYTAELNGRAIEMTPQGFFADPAFQRIDISPSVQHGQNRLVLKTVFHQKPETYDLLEAARKFESEKNRLAFDSEIEAVYLCGAFGVRTPGAFIALPRRAVRCNGPFALAAQPVTVDATRLEQSGFPFFAGTITLQQEFILAAGEHQEPRRIAFADLAAQVAVIRVNGKTAATLTRPDYEAVIPAEALRPGANLLEIDLVTSLRNMLGPHHLEEGESIAIGPGSFYKNPSVYAPQPRPWNDGYCFVRLGITPVE